jgi:hypothetical protein
MPALHAADIGIATVMATKLAVKRYFFICFLRAMAKAAELKVQLSFAMANILRPLAFVCSQTHFEAGNGAKSCSSSKRQKVAPYSASMANGELAEKEATTFTPDTLNQGETTGLSHGGSG